MGNVDKLYLINNKTIPKSINIEDKLYERLKKLLDTKYDATVSEIINICIEDYIDENNPKYYDKPKNETVTYRSIMMRKDNINALQKMHKRTGISVTRLLNASIKEFIDNDS